MIITAVVAMAAVVAANRPLLLLGRLVIGVAVTTAAARETDDARVEEEQRAWIEGMVVNDDRNIIKTSPNTAAFHLDLSRIRVNWEKRILLRIDGFNSELSRKRWPVVYLQRTATGAWKPMKSR